jgi:peptide methionine sulfoxide reductase msrA/msrB
MSDKLFKKLTAEEERVIIHKGTEAPFSGEFYQNNRFGEYHCKRCGSKLFSSNDQFDSGCGWPSFDDEFPDSVKKVLDADQRRTEILCTNCDAHLGHIFFSEGFTVKQKRYCVNSISMNFVEFKIAENQQKAYFAAGCFWGVEYYFSKAKGVIKATSGYMGGKTKNPTYQEICSGKTDHLEAIEVIYDQKQASYQELAKLFFEIHDPTQINGQGPDIGSQYLSAVFCRDENEKKIIKELIAILEKKALKIATKILPVATFYQAELYHQGYYQKNGKTPYCHKIIKRF